MAKIRIKPLYIAIAIVISATFLPGYIKFMQLKLRNMRLENEIARLERENIKLHKEKKRLEEEKRRRVFNAASGEKISKLKTEKENLRLEMYAKSRALSDPRIWRRRDEETAKVYGRRIKEIEKLMAQIDAEIKTLTNKKIVV